MHSICSLISSHLAIGVDIKVVFGQTTALKNASLFLQNQIQDPVLQQPRYLSLCKRFSKKSIYNLRPEALRPNFSISLPNTMSVSLSHIPDIRVVVMCNKTPANGFKLATKINTVKEALRINTKALRLGDTNRTMGIIFF